MQTVTVSDKGQVVIPAEIRRRLGITPGCQLEFSLEGNTIRAEVKRLIQSTRPEDGYGLLVCQRPGERRLSDFDVAGAMREVVRRNLDALRKLRSSRATRGLGRRGRRCYVPTGWAVQ